MAKTRTMKALCTLAGILFAAGLHAQPVITATHLTPLPGESFPMSVYLSSNTGTAGVGVTWNFTSIVPTGSEIAAFISPAGTPHASDFPAANLATNDGGTYTYIQATGSALTRLGTGSGGPALPYSDPENLYVFPFTYGVSWSDNFARSYSAGSYTQTETGTVTALVDGYGTLMLPSGTHNNVLRIKIFETIHITESIAGFNMETDITNTSYHWVKQSWHYPVMVDLTTVRTVDGMTDTYSGGAYYNPAVNGLPDAVNDFSFGLYPNPASGRQVQLAFNATQSENVNVNIFSATGQLVHHSVHTVAGGFNPVQLDLELLEAGVYVVQLQTGNGSVSKKLVLQ